MFKQSDVSAMLMYLGTEIDCDMVLSSDLVWKGNCCVDCWYSMSTYYEINDRSCKKLEWNDIEVVFCLVFYMGFNTYKVELKSDNVSAY